MHRHAGARPDFRIEELPARGYKVNASHFDEIAGGNALNAAIGIVRLGGRASICGPMGDSRETSASYIFEKLAHEGIDTKHIMHMPGLVTPISNIMIDPSGERTIVTFRDPELWKVQLPDADTLLRRLRRHADREPLRRILHRSLRRGPQARHSRDRRCRPHHVAARGPADRVVASGVLQRSPAGHRRHRRRCRGTEEDRKTDAVVPRRHTRPRGTLWLDEQKQLQQTPAFPVHTVDTLGAGDVFHGAFALGITEGQDLPTALRFASAAAALKCTRFGGAFACPQRAEVEALLAHGAAACRPDQPDNRACYRRIFYI